MAVTLRFYAVARELAGTDAAALDLEAAEASQTELRRAVGERFPLLRPHLPRIRLAINGDFAPEEQAVREGDEVAFLPPVAGGAPLEGVLCDVRDEPLSLDECLAAVSRPGAGGVCLFTGVVRDHADGKPVARLDYEAYRELALKDMRRILDELRAAQPELRLAAVHRVGQLSVGDLAVIVAVSAPHRAEAFSACRVAIDQIKETVPIWKKEWDPAGRAHWVNF